MPPHPPAEPTVWPKPWISHVSPFYGTITSNTTIKYESCPMGSKVVRISIGTSDSRIRQLSAKCDDKDNDSLGPWGDTVNSVDILKVVVSCIRGFRQWNITYGSMIDLMTFSCQNSPVSSAQVGRDLSSKTNTVHVSLTQNQSITGFKVSSDLAGIHGISIEYTDFPITDRSVDWIAFDWAFLTIAGVILVAGLAIVFICRLRHKIVLRKLDLDSNSQISSYNMDMARCVDRRRGMK
jgi:hypothetical protein